MPRLPPRQVELLLETLSRALESGLSVPAFLGGAGAALLPPEARRALARTDRSFTSSVAELGVLDRAGLALVEAGERRGDLPTVLRDLAHVLRERRVASEKLRSRAAYPVFLLVAGTVLMPLGTLVSSGGGAYARAVLPTLLALGLAAAVLFVVTRVLPPGSAAAELASRIARGMPVIGDSLRLGDVADACGTLGACLGAGLGAPEALRLAGGEGWARAVEQGASVADAVAAPPALPRDVVVRVAAGEQAGRLPEVLAQCAREQREAALSASTRAVTWIGALLFLGVAAQVARTAITSWSAQVETRVHQVEEP